MKRIKMAAGAALLALALLPLGTPALAQEGMSGEEARAMRESTIKPLRTKRAGLIKKLEQQVKEKAMDGELADTISAIEAVQKEIQVAEEKMREQMKARMTTLQQAKMIIRLSRVSVTTVRTGAPVDDGE